MSVFVSPCLPGYWTTIRPMTGHEEWTGLVRKREDTDQLNSKYANTTITALSIMIAVQNAPSRFQFLKFKLNRNTTVYYIGLKVLQFQLMYNIFNLSPSA